MAYVSKIMSKNFRKEGQPEKERIARITGMDIDKVPVKLASSNTTCTSTPDVFNAKIMLLH